MGSRIFYSEDTGAPVLNGTAGTLIDVLQAVLVTGYGDKQPLGWTQEFYDSSNEIVVFRMPEGSETFLQVIDKNVNGSYNHFAQVRGYESMTSATQGIHPCPAIEEDTMLYFAKSYTNNNATSRPWRIIGDEKGFYLFVAHLVNGVTYNPDSTTQNQHEWKGQYVGDYVPYRQEQKNLFCTTLHNTIVSGHYAITPVTVSDHQANYLMRGVSNERNAVQFGLGTNTHYNTLYFGNNVNFGPLAGNNIYIPTTLMQSGYPLGMLPGLFHPLQLFSSPITFSEMKSFVEKDNNNNDIGICFCIGRMYSSVIQQKIMIKLGENFRNVY